MPGMLPNGVRRKAWAKALTSEWTIQSRTEDRLNQNIIWQKGVGLVSEESGKLVMFVSFGLVAPWSGLVTDPAQPEDGLPGSSQPESSPPRSSQSESGSWQKKFRQNTHCLFLKEIGPWLSPITQKPIDFEKLFQLKKTHKELGELVNIQIPTLIEKCKKEIAGANEKVAFYRFHNKTRDAEIAARVARIVAEQGPQEDDDDVVDEEVEANWGSEDEDYQNHSAVSSRIEAARMEEGITTDVKNEHAAGGFFDCYDARGWKSPDLELADFVFGDNARRISCREIKPQDAVAVFYHVSTYTKGSSEGGTLEMQRIALLHRMPPEEERWGGQKPPTEKSPKKSSTNKRGASDGRTGPNAKKAKAR